MAVSARLTGNRIENGTGVVTIGVSARTPIVIMLPRASMMVTPATTSCPEPSGSTKDSTKVNKPGVTMIAIKSSAQLMFVWASQLRGSVRDA
ncbi:hypothetical protein A6V36_37585 [Paraburkholderia ginsengiterrae]|uniref:Right handed beta helix domain-containing protein n=1 Tax=Paraburkholderia ginsengiterrae TaxID=1462993 RepID=A0ABX2V3R2_9BURK|nr:hypothetical protein A6V36_37585 [Paraburkholderia ginsengiterrae]